jgi:STIP1 family protein 1
MKSYYYLAQAQLALHHPNEALSSALTAYDICLKTNNASTASISSLVLQAKKEKWEAKERERIRRGNDLLRELEDALMRSAAEQIQELEDRLAKYEVGGEAAAEEEVEIESLARQKLVELRNVFAVADPLHATRRVRPFLRHEGG